MNKHRLLELDALRGIAALCVIFYHFIYRYDQLYSHSDLPVEWSQAGQYGVQLFFMISGFVIFWTLNRTQRPLDFIVSRFSRLYPVYWAAIFVTFMIVYLFGLPGREVSVYHALMNVLMFQEYLFIPHVDGVYWTLTVELTFYFWMFVLYLTSQLHRVEEYCLVIIAFSALHSLELLAIPLPIYKILLMKELPMFLAGICFYRLTQESSNKSKILLTLGLSLVSTLAIESTEELFIFAGFYVVFYLATTNKLSFLGAKPLVALGVISYSLYLVHQNIGYVVINHSYQIGLHPAIGIALASVITVVLASVLTKYIEKPALNWIRNLYNKNAKLKQIADKLTFSLANKS